MAQQSSSRLHRLLTLLDTGSSQATRFAAARQIGDIAKLHPQDLNSLLKKVSHYLHSKNWDTRVAAAHAIGAIAENVKHTSLTEFVASIEPKMSEAGITTAVEELIALPSFHPNFMAGLSFRSFDIIKVLDFGALLASGGQEYDVAIDNTTTNSRERLARQKQNLCRRLGLDVCEQFMDVNDMIRDEDLLVHKFDSHRNGINHRHIMSQTTRDIRRLVANMVPGFVSKRPSARELNLLKRKAKTTSKDQTKGWPDDRESQASRPGYEVPSKGSVSLSSSEVFVGAALEDDVDSGGEGQWPFHDFVEQLLLDIFDPVWEVRHGGAMALREILTFQGASAGVISSNLSLENALSVEICAKSSIETASIDSEIDLNVQVPSEDLEPKPKRMKLENFSAPPINNAGSFVTNSNDVICVKVDRSGWDLSEGLVNGEAGVSAVSVECEPFFGKIDSSDESYKEKYLCRDDVHTTETRSHYGDKVSTGKIDVLKNLPENSELLSLAKIARHCWLKNCEFLQDCAIRFLCVLSLDRFGDYVSDQVVAPVRETCAQSLGAVFKYMHPELIYGTLRILLQMQRRSEWEIRHSSLLGIKYLIAVRQEMIHDMLGCVLPACKAGLEDPDDDVRAVAADAIIPAAAAIVSSSNHKLQSLIMLLWDILLDLDDLSPSTSSVMNLLAEIYSHEDMVSKMLTPSMPKENNEFDLNKGVGVDVRGEGTNLEENAFMFATLAPRLWPFMRHNITLVRYSAIRTLERLLEAGYRRYSSELNPTSFWPPSILGDTLRIVFQNFLLDSDAGILECSERVWRLLLQCPVCDLEASARLYMSSWIELAATPYGSPLDVTKMFWPVALPRKSHFRAAAKMKGANLENDAIRNIVFDPVKAATSQEKNGDPLSNSIKIIVGADLEKSVTHTRVVTATALGLFAAKLPEEFLQCIIDPLWKVLTSLSGVQRQVASMILIAWFKEIKTKDLPRNLGVMLGFFNHLKAWLLDLLACVDPAFPTKDTVLPYAELSRTYAKMRNEASLLLQAAEASKIYDNLLSNTKIDLECLSIDDAINFASKLAHKKLDDTGEESTREQVSDDLEAYRQQLLTTAGYLKCVQGNLHVTVSALVAAAVVWMSELPGKLNPVILPLMASIKREQEEMMQQKAAEALAELISHCVARKPGPNDKLIKNLCSLTCMDPSETPQVGVISSVEVIEDQDLLSFGNFRANQKGKAHTLTGGEDRSRVEGFVSRRGSEFALKHLCEKFGASLFEKLPKLWDCLTEVLKPYSLQELTPADDIENAMTIEHIQDPQILINNIQVVRCIAPMLDEALKSQLLTLLPCIFYCVRHSHVAVRLAASRCVTSMAKAMTACVMDIVIERVIPMLGDAASVHARQGAGMLVSLLVKALGMELVPYAALLVVPLLRCMSDSDQSVRQSVTHSFAALVPLLPLARGMALPSGLSKNLTRNTEDAKFLEQLLDSSHIDDYTLSAQLKVTLRRYQQEGINWLAFLRRFNLHGILCDDMGLGKTLQASAIVASDIVEHRALSNNADPLLSLIVCPSTLVGHWAYEIEKYIDASIMTTFQYVGSSQDRIAARDCFHKHNVIITSYDVVRKDIDYLGQLQWNYCILDEGHIVKNAKSKITGAVKQLKAQHRLILSGTPIQNNILDLWSLFDFLMPGFLGTERQFQATYGKPLLASRDSKRSAKDAEAGALAMEALHKQVMPFLLRRTKDQVLSDLPEKIIQDRYCDLSPVQLILYEQFSGSHARKEISSIVKVNGAEESEEGNASLKASTHVFQALQYLLKLCSHPLLVVGDKVSDQVSCLLSDLMPSCSDIFSELHRLQHSPKLVALQEILEECGIGVDGSCSEASTSVGQHRVLIFAQHKAFLDIIERDLFHTYMENVTYLRLDGSVEPEKRFEIVKAFNSDPTIDVLLLTTHVGGLGLNLTSADTLVFMEHDWNPMRDHQAMDRAHRLGQRKVVNVHRLIMRGTLEEKVMSLQRFKLSVANSVINAENASLKTMNTDQLLDLFRPAEILKKGDKTIPKSSDGEVMDDGQSVGRKKGLKAILSGLEELWDQSQYTEEYNLSQFLAKLSG